MGRMYQFSIGQKKMLRDSEIYIIRLESKKEPSANTKPTMAHQCGRSHRRKQRELQKPAQNRKAASVWRIWKLQGVLLFETVSVFCDEKMGDGMENHLVKVTSTIYACYFGDHESLPKRKGRSKCRWGKEGEDGRRRGGEEGSGWVTPRNRMAKSKASQKTNSEGGGGGA